MKTSLSPIFALLLWVVPAAHAQFTYRTNNGTITITGYTGTNLDVVIPSTIDGLPVTSVGTAAFQHLLISSVTIPSSVNSIGEYAFYQCIHLTSLTIPNGVISIGAAAFSGPIYSQDGFSQGCPLTGVVIPDSVKSIGEAAFKFCENLTSVTLGSSVTDVGDNAFADCPDLDRVYFKGNAPTVFYEVFNNGFPTIYYLPGTTGWSTNFGGAITALWTLPHPQVLSGSLGVQTNGFGFTVSWATNASVVVEASTDLGKPSWSPLATNSLAGGWFYFSDPEWTKYPTRFYRIRSP